MNGHSSSILGKGYDESFMMDRDQIQLNSESHVCGDFTYRDIFRLPCQCKPQLENRETP